MNASPYIPLKITSIHKETDDFRTFVFDENPLTYEAGQYLTLVHQGEHGEIRRSYSITSSPELGEPLSIGVKRISNGVYSRLLVDQAKVGDVLTAAGTGGFFKLPEAGAQPQCLYFFAAGAGITPIFAMIKSALLRNKSWKIVLVYSSSSARKAVYLDALNALLQANKERLKIHFLFSDSKQLAFARLDRDQILSVLPEQAFRQHSIYYTCGPAAYMRMVIFVLMEAGISRSNIKKEDFIPLRTHAGILTPPDQSAHMVTLEFNGISYRFQVQYPETILSAARKHNPALPFSCEVGKCGNCVARVRKGNIWMSNNEVLLDEELEKGLVLTCVGYPVHGDAELSMGIK